MANPTQIETTIRVASMRQIHAAIDHLHRGDFECAITLAAAGEGMLPAIDNPDSFLKAMALIPMPASSYAEARVNEVIDWLAHGISGDGTRIELIQISELEMIATIFRAISRFEPVYGITPQMRQFAKCAISTLQSQEERALAHDVRLRR
jgi:hypothetical protein